MLLKNALFYFQSVEIAKICKNFVKAITKLVNLTKFFAVFPQIMWFCCFYKSSVKTSDCLTIEL